MLGSEITIRPALHEDIVRGKEILQFEELCGANTYSEDYYKRLINSHEGIFLVAEINSEVVGLIFGEFSKNEDWADLTGVGVKEQYRKKGIGSQLIQEFERIVKMNDIAFIELFAQTDTLGKFIDKHGFVPYKKYMHCQKQLK